MAELVHGVRSSSISITYFKR